MREVPQNMSEKIETVFAPINLGICPEGRINRKFSNFYIERSGKDIDLTYIGNVSIHKKYRTNNLTPLLLVEDKDEWLYLINKVKQNGSLIGIQLGCRYYKSKAMRKIINKKAELKIEEIKKFILSLDASEIDLIISKFIEKSKQAIDLGFDYIQIHAAHGYLLSLLLSQNLNLRNDKYNSSDCLFIHQIVDNIRKYSSDIGIDLRVSLIEGIRDENLEFQQNLSTLRKLSTLKINMISLSNGIYDINKSLIYPPLYKGFYPMQKYEEEILKINDDIIWNFSGNLNNLNNIKDLPHNDNRSISIGRPLIADPNFLITVRSEDTLTNCNDCGKCHYYTRGFDGIECPKYEEKYSKVLLGNNLI